MNNMLWRFVFGLFICFFGGCETVRQSDPLALKQLQTYEFESTKEAVFSSVVSVLSDLGYYIKSADLNSGVISGKTSSKKLWDPMWGFLTQARDYKRVNAFVEAFSEKKTTVRLMFTEGDNEAAVTDPAVYQNAFNKIGDAVFLYENAR